MAAAPGQNVSLYMYGEEEHCDTREKKEHVLVSLQTTVQFILRRRVEIMHFSISFVMSRLRERGKLELGRESEK